MLRVSVNLDGGLPLSYYSLLNCSLVETVEPPELGTGDLENPNTANRLTAWPLRSTQRKCWIII